MRLLPTSISKYGFSIRKWRTLQKWWLGDINWKWEKVFLDRNHIFFKIISDIFLRSYFVDLTFWERESLFGYTDSLCLGTKSLSWLQSLFKKKKIVPLITKGMNKTWWLPFCNLMPPVSDFDKTLESPSHISLLLFHSALLTYKVRNSHCVAVLQKLTMVFFKALRSWFNYCLSFTS